MNCKSCNSKAKVTGTEHYKNMILRKRVCINCGKVIFTVESENPKAEKAYKVVGNARRLKTKKESKKNEQ